MKLNSLIQYQQIIKFILVGACNTLISFLLFVLFIKILGEERYQASLLVSWSFSSVISFTLQKKLVFQTKGNWLKEYVKCLMTWAIGYCINAVSLELIVQYAGLHVIIGQIIAIILTTISTFLLFKYFAFKR